MTPDELIDEQRKQVSRVVDRLRDVIDELPIPTNLLALFYFVESELRAHPKRDEQLDRLVERIKQEWRERPYERIMSS